MTENIFSPSDFVALLNQTMEIAFPVVIIEGELSEFRVSKSRWVYFNLQDAQASVKFFGSVYNLPGPLEDGLNLRVVGTPKLHPRFGFSITVQSIAPVGEGSIKKAADLLKAKLQAEGLFDDSRKRLLPAIPQSVGLITAAGSAAYADFIKILNERWGGLEVQIADVFVQGQQAPSQIVAAIEYFNEMPNLVDVLALTRGGGSAEDLAAFSDERVVRAVAASRIPTLIAVGHEVDISLSELAADLRASTPTNAASLLVPDKRTEIAVIRQERKNLSTRLSNICSSRLEASAGSRHRLISLIDNFLIHEKKHLASERKLTVLFDPKAALKRGYSIVHKAAKHISKINQISRGDELSLQLQDGTASTTVNKIFKERNYEKT